MWDHGPSLKVLAENPMPIPSTPGHVFSCFVPLFPVPASTPPSSHLGIQHVFPVTILQLPIGILADLMNYYFSTFFPSDEDLPDADIRNCTSCNCYENPDEFEDEGFDDDFFYDSGYESEEPEEEWYWGEGEEEWLCECHCHWEELGDEEEKEDWEEEDEDGELGEAEEAAIVSM